MKHDHAFFKVDVINKPRPGAVRMHDMVLGVLVVCARCGQTRKVWVDGEIEIVVPGTLMEDEHEHSS